MQTRLLRGSCPVFGLLAIVSLAACGTASAPVVQTARSDCDQEVKEAAAAVERQLGRERPPDGATSATTVPPLLPGTAPPDRTSEPDSSQVRAAPLGEPLSDREPPAAAVARATENACVQRNERVERASRRLTDQLDAARQQAQRATDSALIVSLSDPMPLDVLEARESALFDSPIAKHIRLVTIHLELADGYPITIEGPMTTDFRSVLDSTMNNLSTRAETRGDSARKTALDEARAKVEQHAVVTGMILEPAVVEDDARTRATLQRLFGPAVLEVTGDPMARPINVREGEVTADEVSALRAKWQERR